ncbi:uncharacterized protein Z519_09575 [Cladophialophora bantiana CBS 173.52]|uniref:Uncharacterized protein n=1 Tax=Cladophialophora bantiana (strain ATCC 10958 / CBS 173.52 / CDC B-1940 / NIH 8579) TaxID=1442370 RepID=A0A0D2HA77_CLAB1|nr:uncharacterized protein Z519_09575 [Cladophialophora bantiana CBS 173.52]KIW90143.1 hypothetical protein Z519_09575 [Cladophialophora bantiana CBS 173.52]
MWGKFLSVFKGKGPARPSNRRHSSTPSDPFGDEEETPPSSENREGRLHHTLEESLGRNPRDEDALDAEDDEDVPIRHHTLEENIELARELSQELRRQSEELKQSSGNKEHAGGRSDKSQ